MKNLQNNQKCIQCGSPNITYSQNHILYACSTCGLNRNVISNDQPTEFYKKDRHNPYIQVPKGCLLILSWEKL